ncbi:unnamed protein product [Callosobruchus maculatus]|uniref:Uncharacterized protein n=1 Tax=Callosobruchus maculatus TaxID=64391 RepID=A0A653C6X9_CALMS|nr:unnamed protein product [Callosobruchus maculatus]
MDVFNYKQSNTVFNQLGRTLDLVIAQFICEVERDELPLVPEDDHHPALIVNLSSMFIKEPQFYYHHDKKTYNYRKADFVSLYVELGELDWDNLFISPNVDNVLEKMYDTIFSIFDKHIPLYRNHAHKYPRWYNSEIIRNVKLKSKYRKKFVRFGRKADLDEFRSLRRLLKHQIKLAYDQYTGRYSKYDN